MRRSDISGHTLMDASGREIISHAGMLCGRRLFNRESQDIYGCLVTQIYSLDVLRKFCEEHSLAKAGENEYNFFMNGHAADYWIRFITRERDYNLYLKAFAKNFNDAEK